MKQTELEVTTLAFLELYDGPCPHCSFHLKKPQTHRCPECGGCLVLSLKQPFRCTSWLLFTFGLIASVGVCVDQAGLFIAARVINNVSFLWSWILPELVLSILLFVGLMYWWKLRVWALNLSPVWKGVVGACGLFMPFFWFSLLFMGFFIQF